MTLTEFKDLSEAIQAIIISIGVIIGGAWALYQFFSLNTVTKAKKELEKLKKDLLERGSIKIELDIQQSGNVSKLVIINAKLANTGSRDEILNWKKSHIAVARVMTNQNGTIYYASNILVKLRSILGDLTSSTLPPHTESEFPFVVKISEPGMYLFELLLEGSQQEQKIHHELITNSGLSGGIYVWSARKYFEVI